ncbi:MAG: hypothetical protein PHD02_00855 [Bacilli bacterium]|nr:hypothetical protein [Bacilli bacterium]
MKILKQENWWVWLLLFIFSEGTSNVVLGALLGVFDKNAWYAKWKNWALGLICFIFPAFIMAAVFIIQITCLTAAKLNVKGSEYYLSPFVWLLLLIIPVIGWSLMMIMMAYIYIWTIVALYKGEGNKYAK